MLSVEEARRVVLERCERLAARATPLTQAHGRVLAESVAADIDMPPLDRSVMDGYAVRCADLPSGKATLHVIEEITAGRIPTLPLAPGQASRIMTGAPIPTGADAVVVVERTRLELPDRVTIDDAPPKPGQHILRRGEEMRRGDRLLEPGSKLRPQEIGLLASAGRAQVTTIAPPRVAILPTGDELVEPEAYPGPGQIRNSNAYMLHAQVERAGAVAHHLGIGRDSLESLAPLIAQGLGLDVLILSGGVSAGTRDLVPQALAEAGVVAHFHQVRLKPGKPLLFGSAARPERTTLVFGLPGNPVSSFVCFELFIRPALRKLAGLADVDLFRLRAPLSEPFAVRGDRPIFAPARLDWPEGVASVRAVPWFGSADLRALHQANALLCLPPGEVRYPAGHPADVLWLDG